jgi:D-xylose transport system substrate-binding protein
MRKSRLGLATAAAIASLVLAGCGGSSSGGTPSANNNSSSPASASGKVGVILPDATTSPRWESNDRPLLKAAFDAAGLGSDIQNANGDKSKFATICDSMINEGVKVLAIVNLDSETGAACLKKAQQAGIQTIDYDRLTLGGGASYYVSFDNVQVGKLMGQGLVTCLNKMGKTSGVRVVMIDGDPTDNNAALFKQGYKAALQPMFASGKYKLVGDVSGEWNDQKAANAFDGLYTKNNGKIDGVVSANDTMAGGIIARLAANNLAGKVPVTGQDASIEGLQRVLDGTQCMTVYKNTNLEADLASKLAIAVIKGDKSGADALATKTVPDTTTNKDVKSALATPEAIYKDGVKKVIDEGFQKASDVCTGKYAKLCTDAGIS